MKHFLIVTNYIKDENLSLTSEIENYIAIHGGTSNLRLYGQAVSGAL